jgi:hypothetical protein
MDTILADENVMDPSIWKVLGYCLGAAFVASLIMCYLMMFGKIDHGFLGLIFLLVLVIFLAAFSFLVAAITPGISIKVAITVIDGAFALGTKLLSNRFLEYLESEPLGKSSGDKK